MTRPFVIGFLLGAVTMDLLAIALLLNLKREVLEILKGER